MFIFKFIFTFDREPVIIVVSTLTLSLKLTAMATFTALKLEKRAHHFASTQNKTSVNALKCTIKIIFKFECFDVG